MIAIKATAEMAADKEAVGLSSVHMNESTCSGVSRVGLRGVSKSQIEMVGEGRCQ